MYLKITFWVFWIFLLWNNTLQVVFICWQSFIILKKCSHSCCTPIHFVPSFIFGLLILSDFAARVYNVLQLWAKSGQGGSLPLSCGLERSNQDSGGYGSSCGQHFVCKVSLNLDTFWKQKDKICPTTFLWKICWYGVNLDHELHIRTTYRIK